MAAGVAGQPLEEQAEAPAPSKAAAVKAEPETEAAAANKGVVETMKGNTNVEKAKEEDTSTAPLPEKASAVLCSAQASNSPLLLSAPTNMAMCVSRFKWEAHRNT